MITPTIESRPDPALRPRVIAAGALGLIAIVVLAWLARILLGLSERYQATAAAVFAAIVAAALLFVYPHHPFARFGPANCVTLARALLVALLTALLIEPTSRATAWVAASASGAVPALDGVDGWLARRTHMQSTFGARFDMEIDALHVLVLSGLIWQYDKAGAWVWIGGLLRYGFVAASWLLPWLAQPLRPTRRARVITIVHMTTLSVGLAPFVPAAVSATAAAISVSALAWSFAVDIGRLWRGEGAR